MSEQSPKEKLYTIGTVARITGVSPITLRAWERRYDLIKPVRKNSGHRLYTRRHIDLINRITALTGKGLRLSQIHKSMLEQPAAFAEEQSGAADFWRGYLDSMVAAIADFDETRLEHIYNEALALYPFDIVRQRLMEPLLRELGRRWESARGSVAEEHFLAFYLRNKLCARFHHRSPIERGARLLIACLPGEQHEMGMLIFALAAHEAGYRVLALGANMPLGELAPVARKAGCAAVVLSGFMEPASGVLDADLPRLVAAVNVPVVVGGEVSVASCKAITRAGAEALGRDIGPGLNRLGELLGRSG